MGINIRDSL